MLIAFKTAPDKRPLYKQGALDMLAYPNGWKLILSYRKKWIDRPLRKPLRDNKLVGQKMLVVLCGNVNSSTHEFGTVVPLRWATIQDSGTRHETDILYLLLTLDDRPSKSLVAKMQGTDRDFFVVPLAGKGSYVTQSDTSVRDKGALSWDEHIGNVRQIREVQDSIFFRVRALRERSSGKAATIETTEGQTTVIDLRSAMLYELELYVDGDSLSGRGVPLELLIEGEHLEIARPLLLQHGSGAIVTYLIVVKRKYTSDLATLLVQPSDESKSGAEIRLLVRMGPNWAFWPLTILGLITGWLLTQVDGTVLPSLASQAPILMGLKLAGALVLAGTGWAAFRNLPVKL